MATYAQEQAEDLLKYYQGMSGTARQPTALSSREEQRAFQAQDVREGGAPIEMLPEQYGGRPTGESRRAIRMQEAYDARQAQLLQQQRVMQQMEQEQKEIAIREQEQQSRIENMNIARDAALAKAAREAKVKEQSRNIREAFLGSTLPDGSKILPINLNEKDAPERIQRTMYMNDFGMEDQATKEMASMLLDDALRIREKRSNEIAAQSMADTQARVGIAKDLAQNGLSIADFSENGKVNFEKANIALGEELRKKEAGKEEAIDEREQKRALRRQKASAETELVKIKSQVGRFEKLRPTGDNIRELEAARVSQGIFEDEINRINNELGGEAQEPEEPSAETGETPQYTEGIIARQGGKRYRYTNGNWTEITE
jgi:hypothetical protein